MGAVFVGLSVCCEPAGFAQDRATSYASVRHVSQVCCIPVTCGSLSEVWQGQGRVLECVAVWVLVCGHGVLGVMAPVVGW